MEQCCIALHGTVLHCTAWNSAALPCMEQCCTALHGTELHITDSQRTRCCSALYGTELPCNVLYLSVKLVKAAPDQPATDVSLDKGGRVAQLLPGRPRLLWVINSETTPVTSTAPGDRKMKHNKNPRNTPSAEQGRKLTQCVRIQGRILTLL